MNGPTPRPTTRRPRLLLPVILALVLIPVGASAASADPSSGRVPDPVSGDLRVDPHADVLPLAYEPPAATTTRLGIAYGPRPAQRLDLYLPDEPDAPVVVFLHSGGWIAGTKAAVPDLVLRFVERGYAVASVDYRLAPDHPFPKPVHDVKRAIRWLKAYGATNALIDGNQMVLYGTSAGGHLAAFAAATPGHLEPTDLSGRLAAHDSTVAGLVSVVGPVDLVGFYRHNSWSRSFTNAFLGCDPCRLRQLRAASPLHHLHGELPPAYWAYGADDGLVDANSQGASIAAAWAGHAGSGSSWLDVVEGSGHNLDESSVNQRAIEAFIDGAVAGRPTDPRRHVAVTVVTGPAARATVDGVKVSTPFVLDAVARSHHRVAAPAEVCRSGEVRRFFRWSNGGARAHSYTNSGTDDTVVARYVRTGNPCPALCMGQPVTVRIGLGQRPTVGPDVILGTAGADAIRAGGGDDRICGLGGDDRIFAGTGADRIRGDAGDDLIRAGRGVDRCVGGSGVDVARDCERVAGTP